VGQLQLDAFAEKVEYSALHDASWFEPTIPVHALL
jgi:hypothetical protein